MMVVPIGGGGLISGIAIAAKALKPDIELIGVEAELYPSMKNARSRAGMTPLGGDTLAEGIAVKEPGELTARSSTDLVDDIDAGRRARHRTCGGDARRDREDGRRRRRRGRARGDARPPGARSGAARSATILCGGNIDTHLLANVLVRDLVRLRPHRAAPDRGAGPAGRARRDHRQVPRSRRQHHRDQPPAGSSPGCRPRTR